jgi:hypothetical protein
MNSIRNLNFVYKLTWTFSHLSSIEKFGLNVEFDEDHNASKPPALSVEISQERKVLTRLHP